MYSANQLAQSDLLAQSGDQDSAAFRTPNKHPHSTTTSTSSNHKPTDLSHYTGYIHYKELSRHKMTPGIRPPSQDLASTFHTANQHVSRQPKQVDQIDTDNINEDWEYLQHLRKVLRHLEHTAAILENKSKSNKTRYRRDLQQMRQLKHNLDPGHSALQEQLAQLRHSLKQRTHNP